MRRHLKRITTFLFLALFFGAILTFGASAVTVTMSVQPGGGGSAVASSYTPNPGDTVTITATPETGYRFDHWYAVKGTVPAPFDDTKAVQSITAPENDLILRAYFVPDVYSVTVEYSDLPGGSLSFVEKTFAPGAEVRITAHPYSGFTFTKWESEDMKFVDPQNLTLSFLMPEKDVTVSALFSQITYRFRVNTGKGGTVSVEGKSANAEGYYECTGGEEIDLIAEAEDDYAFGMWTGTSGVSFSDPTASSTTLLTPASDFTLKAEFISLVKKITVISTEGGSVREEGEFEYRVDDVIDLSAVPEEGYVFAGWECSDRDGVFADSTARTTSFTVPGKDCTVTAHFQKGGYKLTLAQTIGGKAVGEDGNYEMGQTVILEAIPEEGYVFSSWKCTKPGVILAENSPKIQISMPGEDIKVTAVFILAVKADTETENPVEPAPPGESLPWLALTLIFLVSALAIAVIILREHFDLTVREMIRRLFPKK